MLFLNILRRNLKCLLNLCVIIVKVLIEQQDQYIASPSPCMYVSCAQSFMYATICELLCYYNLLAKYI